jgi:TetR/AcrR family transcriptional repressor of nem operon
MKANETREDIVRIGAEIIGQGGFNATGIDSVLKKARVPKGSFYYYFHSKEEFGLAVIDQQAREFAQVLETYLKDSAIAPLDRIRRYFESRIEVIENNQCRRGCLIGNLGQELASQSEKFRKRLEEVFCSWKMLFEACLEEAKQQGGLAKDADSRLLADFLLTGWEGAILRAKVMKSIQPMQDFMAVFFQRVVR